MTGPFDLVKIDVEGYELEVLQGAAPMFARDDRPRALFVELHEPVHSGALAELLPGYNAERVSVPAHAATEHWVARFRGTQDPAHQPS